MITTRPINAFFQHIMELLNRGFINTVLIGLTGSILAITFKKDRPTFWQSLSIILGGIAASIWLAPLFCEWSGSEENGCTAIKFICGLLGMRIIGTIIRLFSHFEKNPVSWMKAFFQSWRDVPIPDDEKKNNGNSESNF